MRHATVIIGSLLLAACGSEEAPPPEVDSYNIDRDRITVSGVSSGAMMATQFHVAHSDFVSGAGQVAGGAYYCAEASLNKGLGPCMKGGDIGVPALVEYANSAAGAGTIDELANLADDPVWLFLGKNDAIMHADTTAAAAAFYAEVSGTVPVVITDVAAPHGFPTMYSGATCTGMAEPWLNACKYDAAGEILKTLYGELNEKAEPVGEVIEVQQPGGGDVTMLTTALAYVPTSCASGDACGIHVAFHGCQQSTAFVGDVFAKKAGYNTWAESNDLIVLYPQVDSSKIAPMNPMGCWDWWGYTDEHYATQNGRQIAVVKATLDLLAGETL